MDDDPFDIPRSARGPVRVPARFQDPDYIPGRKKRKARSSDPVFEEKRRRWLRELHRQSLYDRARVVLGSEGIEFVNECYTAANTNAVGDLKADYNAWMRKVLRGAAHIPANQPSRRIVYVRSCLKRECPSEATEQRDRYEELEHLAPPERLVQRIGSEQGSKLLWALANVFIFTDRGDRSADRGGRRVQTIVEAACRSRNPARYIVACLRNERQSKRVKKKPARKRRPPE